MLFFRRKPVNRPNRPKGEPPLPPQIVALLRESWWLSAVVAGVYLVIILASYTSADPGWSHSATQAPVRNKGGAFGAWLADVLLYLFGLSAWWWVVFCLAAILWGYRRLERIRPNRSLTLVALTGFSLMLLSSASLEAIRISLPNADLPMAPGGLLGITLGNTLFHQFGFTGATLALLTSFAVGVSLFLGVSWLGLMERIGGWIEDGALKLWHSFQAKLDRRAGVLAAERRAAKVEREKERPAADEPPTLVDTVVEPPVATAAPAPAPPRREPTLRRGKRQEPVLEPSEADDEVLVAPEPSIEPPAAPQRLEPAITPAPTAAPSPVMAPTPSVAPAPAVKPPPPESALRAARAAALALAEPPAPTQLEPQEHALSFDNLPPIEDEEEDLAPPARREPHIGRLTPVADDNGFAETPPWDEPDLVPELEAEPISMPPLSAPLPPVPVTPFVSPTLIPPPPVLPRLAPQRLPPAPATIEVTLPPLRLEPDRAAELPALDLLAPPPATQEIVSPETLDATAALIERKLAEFGVEVKVVHAFPGPVITRYEIEPAVGVKGSQIVNLMKDLARALGLVSIRVVETIPGKTYMGLELPNQRRQVVRLAEVIGAQPYHDSSSLLTIALGKDISGRPIVTDLAKAPHMLVAGTTGSGKSVAINAMILSLLYKATAEQVRLIMVDPKMLELSVYEGIPHLLAPVVTDMKQAANALNWCVAEMEKRYRLMSALGVRNLAGFNQKLKESAARGEKLPNPFSLTPDSPEPLAPLPLIVVVIDELADLMMVAGKKIEELIARLAQKARAAGIHLVLATQRPSVDVITGLIKANIPTRVAFQVSSKIDSRTILDQMGAEALLGQGDMLFLPPGTGYPQRVHGAYVADDEVHAVVEFLKTQGEPDYIDGILTGTTEGDGGNGPSGGEFGLSGDGEGDALYDEAVAFVLKSRKASISAVQRQLRIGYNRAARLIEQMENAGLVSPMEPNGNRSVLVPDREA
ncbi:DNA translocase FtsK [Chitinimonas lacunae]|uniref:DNA translocase FtsK 4TM domain-containing protein n=1 Tax=Chitinimonas lacunae TaxID=1963018 RepID=A0ABV8MPF5_9NEIS